MRLNRPLRLAVLITWLLVAGLGIAVLTSNRETSSTPTTSAPALYRAIGWTMGRASAVAFWNPNSASATGSLTPVTTIYVPVNPIIPGRPTTTIIESGYLSVLTVRAIIEDYFEPEDVDQAIRLCWCLSSFNSRSFDPVSGNAGLFKLPNDQWEELSGNVRLTGANIFDPVANIKAAAWIVYNDSAGWANWVCGS